MATFYKTQRDSKKKHAPWYFDYTDHTGKRRTVKGFTDKPKTEQLASNLEQRAHLIRTGIIDPQQEAIVKQKNSSVESHLTDFEKHLIRQKVTLGQVKKAISRIRSIIEGCEIKILRDISGDSVEAFLGDLCLGQDLVAAGCPNPKSRGKGR